MPILYLFFDSPLTSTLFKMRAHFEKNNDDGLRGRDPQEQLVPIDKTKGNFVSGKSESVFNQTTTNIRRRKINGHVGNHRGVL